MGNGSRLEKHLASLEAILQFEIEAFTLIVCDGPQKHT